MNTKQEQMQSKPIFSLLVSMAIPMMFSMLIQSLYNIIDSIFVAQLGNDAFTAVSLIYPLQNLVISIAVGFGVGVSSCISIAMGSKDKKHAEHAASTGIVCSILHSLLFVLFGLFATKPFLRLFTDDLNVIEMGASYGYVVLCLAFGAVIQVCFEKIFQALGNMTVTMYVLAAGALINIILDPIFIFGYLGFPAMGVTGAAIATVCGQIGGLILYLIYYNRNKSSIAIDISLKHVRFSSKLLKQLYGVGIPSSIMLALPSLLISVLNGMLVAYSQIHVSILGIYYKLQSFIYLPAGGIVQGMRPILGFNYGAGENVRVKKTLHLSILFTACIMFVGTVLSFCMPVQILSMFHADETMLTVGVPALRIISLGFIVSTLGVIYSGAFEAFGYGIPSLVISLLRQLVIIIPLSLVLSQHFGAYGIWISFPLSECIAAIVSVLLMKRFYKKNKM